VSGEGIVAGVAGRGSRACPRPNNDEGVAVATAGRVATATGVGRIVVAGARGGQCTSTVAAAIALVAAGHRPTALVAVEPDASAALLGVPVPSGDGRVAVTTTLELLGGWPGAEELVVVDAGRRSRTVGSRSGPAVVGQTVSLVVVRGPCYLALRSLVAGRGRLPDGIVVAREDGRSLTANDVRDVTGVPVVAEIDVTAHVARTIDAGLLAARLHRLPELAPLRRWTTHLLTPRRPSGNGLGAPLTAVNEVHRLSTCAVRK